MSTAFRKRQSKLMENPFLLNKVKIMNTAYSKSNFEIATKLAREVIAQEPNLIDPYHTLEDVFDEVGAPLDRQYANSLKIA